MLTDERLREIALKHWAAIRPDYALGGWTLVLAMQVARAVESEARREALEEAAKACDQNAVLYPSPGVGWESSYECAAAIRALGEKP